MALAGYKPSLAGYEQVLESPHVKDLKELVLCSGRRPSTTAAKSSTSVMG